MRRSFSRGPLLGLAVAMSASCNDRPMLDSFPSSVIEVDTNLPVPLAISRLRVDLYSEDGTWFQSSDFARADPLDWPVSFGVFSENEAAGATVWVRLRGYVEGEVEDYRGERLRDWPNPFEEVPQTDNPRLMRDGVDITPKTAPRPLATIDRLLRVRLEPKKTGRVHALLHGACVGTMVKMGENGAPDATSETCIDTAKTRMPVPTTTPVESQPARTTSEQGTWLRVPCEASAPDAKRACIPGGATVLGLRSSIVDSFLPDGSGVTPPVRIFGLRRFYIDREEVSVGRFRDAVARGLKTALPFPTEGPLDPVEPCTWSAKPRDREELPVVCIDWNSARDFCRFEGGDLPSEVEWEHAATIAGYDQKQLYPWGNDQLGCEEAIFGRSPTGGGISAACKALGVLPVPVDSGPGDVNPLGVHGLGGGAREWTRDIFAPYTSQCWAAADIENPFCRTVSGSFAHTFRGQSWYVNLAPVASRVAPDESVNSTGSGVTVNRTLDTGLRCVYDGPEGAP